MAKSPAYLTSSDGRAAYKNSMNHGHNPAIEEHKEEVMSILKSEWSHDLGLEVREEIGMEKGELKAMQRMARAMLDGGKSTKKRNWMK
jgi:hypothetical protein